MDLISQIFKISLMTEFTNLSQCIHLHAHFLHQTRDGNVLSLMKSWNYEVDHLKYCLWPQSYLSNFPFCDQLLDLLAILVLHLNTNTTVIQYKSAVSCRVVSWVASATSLIWAILVVIKCTVMWKSKRCTYEIEESCQLKSHKKSNSHEGSQRVTRVSYPPWLYIPPHCMSKLLFNLAPPT